MSLPSRDLWWPRNLRALQRSLCWPFSISRRWQISQCQAPQDSAPPNSTLYPQQELDLRALTPMGCSSLPLPPSGLRSLLATGMDDTAPAAGILSGSSVAAPGSCCDAMSHVKDKDCCPLLCARLVSSHLSVLLFWPGYFLKAK